jgi:predicted transcriptional regulator
MTEAIEAIRRSITAIKAACETTVAKVREDYDEQIAKHEQAIALLSGKLNGSKPRPKLAQASKPKRTRATKVDPNLAEDKEQIMDAIQFASPAAISCDAIVTSCGIKKPRVSVLLRQLIEAGTVVREGKARGTTYRLAESKGEEAAAQ